MVLRSPIAAGVCWSGMPEPAKPSESTRTRWKWVLVLPFAGLCFPGLYARATPVLFGFPFFYWYQFVWVFVASAIMVLVYRKLRY